ncbi:MAG: ABC transporter permease [Lachnospiraceae bacterium]|nr:ABC transporter permease [Lachnospiraceae bacterium]
MKKLGNSIVASGIATWAILILLWFLASLSQDETFLPSPLETVQGTKEIITNGKLLLFSFVSLKRVLIGWSIGTLVAAPLGLVVGRVGFLRKLVEPFVNFFRFIPAMAFLTLFLMWFGVGESSKLILIIYGTVFTVMVNTIAGVIAVDPNRINSARTLGASEWQIIRTVIWPSIIPYVFTGARLGLGGSFSSIIAAEMLASKEGLGYLIYTSRLYFHTDWIFAGIICLGLLGYLSDKLLRILGNHLLKKYGVHEKVGF